MHQLNGQSTQRQVERDLQAKREARELFQAVSLSEFQLAYIQNVTDGHGSQPCTPSERDPIQPLK